MNATKCPLYPFIKKATYRDGMHLQLLYFWLIIRFLTTTMSKVSKSCMLPLTIKALWQSLWKLSGLLRRITEVFFAANVNDSMKAVNYHFALILHVQ